LEIFPDGYTPDNVIGNVSTSSPELYTKTSKLSAMNVNKSTETVAVGDGSVCFKEFKLIQSQCEAGRQRQLSQQSRDAEQRMRTAFKVFDIDGNGVIDTAELRATLAGLGSCVSLPDAEELLRAADKNGDGQIDYEGNAKSMSVNHGEDRGTSAPEFGVGNANTNCPPHPILLCFNISSTGLLALQYSKKCKY